MCMQKRKCQRIKLKGIKLRNVCTEKDLGVIIDQHLKFNSHISSVFNQGNQIAVLIRRTMTFMEPSRFVMLFKTFARSHFEYTVASWNPHLMKYLVAIEKVESNKIDS